MSNDPHVIILGAGFAGIGAMKQLRKAPVKVTLIDRNDYHAFLPLLYQVATDELAPDEVGFPVREMLAHRQDWDFHQADVTAIDLDARTVSVTGMPPLSYDYLVIGLGAVVNFFGTAGAAEHAYPLYTLHDAVVLKKHVLDRFEAADKDPALVDDGALRFCVVGGGATGIETAGALGELLRDELKHDFPNLPVAKAEVHLYELGDHLLAPYAPKLQQYARRALEDRGVQVHLGEGVVAVEPTRVHLKSGAVVDAHTLVWGAGLGAHPLAESLGEELVKGRLPARPDLSLAGHPEVFVTGDIAMITDEASHDQLPQLGSVAQQAGQHAAENIARIAEGKPSEPFRYKDKGTMATVGRGAAVVEFRSGRTMTGHAAWMAWLGVHLVLLSGGEEKGLTFTDWGWNIMTHKRHKGAAIE